MPHKPLTLYKRQVTEGKKPIYYVQYRDPQTGRRLPGRSTGQTSKRADETWCVAQMKIGIVDSSQITERLLIHTSGKEICCGENQD